MERPFWLSKIREAWGKRPVVWLSGVRRSGKTTLARMIEGAEYFNCDLPSTERRLADPEPLFDSLPRGATLVLDEVHRLEDPSRVLKIAADEYPHLKILATGSSTLAATRKFRDSLTGRERSIVLPPVLWSECLGSFGVKDLDARLLRGGLPEPLLSGAKAPSFFSEWMDGFYARDIQELFAIRNRGGFLKLLGLLMDQSGGLLDYTKLAGLSELSRPTVMAHVEALRVVGAVFLLTPLHGRGRREIVRRPKAYAFDTGFVTFVRGWDRIREEDRGILWEHLVLDGLRAVADESSLRYWMDKSGREVDFIVRRSAGRIDALECKINPERAGIDSIVELRRLYPEGRNYVVSPFIKSPYERRVGGFRLRFTGFEEFLQEDWL